jgi:hypothetical protein
VRTGILNRQRLGDAVIGRMRGRRIDHYCISA